jgi:hypothetical protein
MGQNTRNQAHASNITRLSLTEEEMRHWWVNQNQTYRHEVQGGYLWSPKRNANGARNPFYESMREVAPGDLIFSFMDTRILAIGIAQSYCWESPKPPEFGAAGQNWENIGWKVKVNFTELTNKVRPKDHIDVLRPFLPDRYSPLQPNGNGLQSVYLTEVPAALAEMLRGLIGEEVAPLTLAARDVKPVAGDDLDVWERRLEQQIVNDSTVPETERLAIIPARNGFLLPSLFTIKSRPLGRRPAYRYNSAIIDGFSKRFLDVHGRLNEVTSMMGEWRRIAASEKDPRQPLSHPPVASPVAVPGPS